MKLCSKIIAFYAIQTAAAFVHPPATKTFKSTSSYFATKGGKNEDTVKQAAPAAPSAGTGAALSKSTDKAGGMQPAKSVWEALVPIKVQGGALRTWSITDPAVERVQVFLKTEGRPLMSNIELWQGPDNTPQKMAVYLEDGGLRPFSAVIETPKACNAVAIYNTHSIEFPLEACVEADVDPDVAAMITDTDSVPRIVQGGAIFTIPFAPSVQSVQVLLKTDGRPLNARIELLQGPNNNKQVIEFYSEDGQERPFFCLIETPGVGNVIRICNTATVEFPLSAVCKPFLIDPTVAGEGSSGKFIVK